MPETELDVLSTQTEVALFSANDEYEPSLNDIMTASDEYAAARSALRFTALNLARDEKHWRESLAAMQAAQSVVQATRDALLRAIGAVPSKPLLQEVTDAILSAARHVKPWDGPMA